MIVMRQMLPLGVVAIVWVGAAGISAADLQTGEAQFQEGEYRQALATLNAITGKDKPTAQLLVARILRRQGRLSDAARIATRVSRQRGTRALDAEVLVAEIARDQGKYKGAKQRLDRVLRKSKNHLRARWLMGLTLRDLGELANAHKVFNSFVSDWNAKRINRRDPQQLFYVAEATRYLSLFQDANDSYRDAVQEDPRFFDANIQWGYMFLEKYDAGNAQQSFDEVLKIDPHHPDAHAGMAAVKLVQSYDIAKAHSHIELALKTNPNHAPALVVRASLEIDQNRWKAATTTLKRVLKINEYYYEALALRATIHWLRDETDDYNRIRKKVLASNPAYAQFYHIVARSAVREHRYRQAIELERQAVKINPKYYEAMQAIGTGHLRLGQEKKGLRWLRKAWQGDQYNERTKRTLDLFEGALSREYTFVNTGPFRLRYHKDELAILRKHVEPMLLRAYADMVKRYKFTPVTPTVIELFREHNHYSVRTVGLPNLGALGVCFGQVITAMSPTVGNVNWGMVLWHELAHVFAIQISKSRVPRWFTEGLSEYETLVARPEWRRQNDTDIAGALYGGTLPSVTELNHGFMKPDQQQVVISYHLSSVVIEYIARKWGFDAIVQALHLFGSGKETPQVISAITGLSVQKFDKSFEQYLRKRLAPYKDAFRLPNKGFDDLKKLEIALDASPKSADAHANLALGRFFDGNAGGAQQAAENALKLAPQHKVALYILAELARLRRQPAQAKKRYYELIRAGGDNFDIRARLGELAAQSGNISEAEKQYCAAKQLEPERSFPYGQLARIYKQANRHDDALREMESFVMLEQMQYAPLRDLVASYAKRKSWDKVRRYGELALFINPFDAQLKIHIGNALASVDADRALSLLDEALKSRRRLRRPALAHLARARAFVTKGARKSARAAVKQALKTEPNHAEALKLQAELATP